MRSQFLKIAVAMLLILGLFAGNAWAKKTHKADKPSKPKLIECKGKVEVTKDKDGNIEAVELRVGSLRHIYHITLDEKGKELGEKMPGKEVNVKGVLSKKADADCLTVTEYSEVPSESEKKTDKK